MLVETINVLKKCIGESKPLKLASNFCDGTCSVTSASITQSMLVTQTQQNC